MKEGHVTIPEGKLVTGHISRIVREFLQTSVVVNAVQIRTNCPQKLL